VWSTGTQKWYFAHTSLPFDLGLFALWGEDYDTLNNYVQIYRLGVDWRGRFGSFYPFLQLLAGMDNDSSALFYGGFFGLDYDLGDNVLSLLLNYVDAPVYSSYRSQRLLAVALRLNHYLLENLKVFVEDEVRIYRRSNLFTLGVDFAF